MKFYKISILFLILLCLFSLTACRSGGVKLFSGADPDRSALTMYYFDGHKVSCRTIYDAEIEKKIFKEYLDLSLEEIDFSSLTAFPGACCGFEIAEKENGMIRVACADGLYLTEEGKAYKGDTSYLTELWDLFGETYEEFINDESVERDLGGNPLLWVASEEKDGVKEMLPCIAYLKNLNDLYKTKMDVSAFESPEGIHLKVCGIKNQKLILELTNESEEDFFYGEYFTIYRKEGTNWIQMSFQPDMAFIDLGYILMAGESRTLEKPLDMVMDMKAGDYGIYLEGAFAAFSLDQDIK